MDTNIPADNKQRTQEFMGHLTGVQTKLMRYITALLGDPEAAGDVLQETNLLLWQKADDFTPGSNFEAWAVRTAYWKVQAYTRDRGRGRKRYVFSEKLLDQLSARPAATEDIEPLVTALRQCIARLRKSDQHLLALRYSAECSLQDLAEQLDRTPAAIKGLLLRARRSLRICVTRQQTS